MLFSPQTSNLSVSTIVFAAFLDIHFKRLNISLCQKLLLFMTPLFSFILPITEYNKKIEIQMINLSSSF